MKLKVCIEVEEELLLGLNKSPEELGRDMRLAAAVKWYEMGTVSQERAAQMAGLSRTLFIESLARFGVSPFQEAAEDVLNDRSKSDNI